MLVAAGAAKLLTRAFCSLADKSKGLALALRDLQRIRVSQESEYPSNMTVSWITPDERKARDDADREARIAIAIAQGKLPNEPTVPATKEVSEPAPHPKPVLLLPPLPKWRTLPSQDS
jgi:hypothetical protein